MAGSFHRFIATKFLEKGDCFSRTIQRCTARKILYINHVPLRIHDRFLKEMETYKLIKIIDSTNIEILTKKKEEDWF
jgi:hypothetical protein